MKKRIYLDNCCFNRPYDDQTNLSIEIETKAKLFIQSKIASGDVELVWSYMLEYENSNNPYIEKKNAIARWKDIAACYVDESEELILLAESITYTGVKISDSVHIAAAIIADCSHFITTDKRILKYKTEHIRICNPIDYLRDWSENNDD